MRWKAGISIVHHGRITELDSFVIFGIHLQVSRRRIFRFRSHFPEILESRGPARYLMERIIQRTRIGALRYSIHQIRAGREIQNSGEIDLESENLRRGNLQVIPKIREGMRASVIRP